MKKAAELLGFVKKAVGALLGGATGVGVGFVLHAFGLDVDAGTAASIASVCAMLGALISPANKLTVRELAKQVAQRTEEK